MSKRGFTLIELLVVIAIIGILASIVLVSFPGATKRARDSRVMSAIAQARTEMTSYNANQGTYVNWAPSGSIQTEIDNNCADGGDVNSTCDEGVEWDYEGGSTSAGGCIWATLNEKDAATWYCADSTGIAGRSGGATAVNPTTTCNDTAFTCPAGTAL